MSGYIGTAPVPQATQTRDSFTATSGQTSFATGGYTPNFLDIFLNGVKLASADYTATNGSDVVLASGAATGDILEVVAFTTFNSASSSIDDNGNATALTIDSSENILAGKTSSAFNTAGFELFGNADKGKFWATRDGGVAAAFNRKSSDGDIALFAKDGTTVGTIGVSGSDLFVGRDSCTLKYGNNELLPAYTGNGNVRNDAISLGSASGNFKDLYLSGGVYLGGTGAANKLDEVETGTWSPQFFGTGATFTMTLQDGHYSKIGTSVTVYFRATWSSKNGAYNTFIFNGLPFTAKSNSGQYYYMGSTDHSHTTAAVAVEGNATNAIFFNTSGGAVNNSSIPNSGSLVATVTYISAS